MEAGMVESAANVAFGRNYNSMRLVQDKRAWSHTLQINRT